MKHHTLKVRPKFYAPILDRQLTGCMRRDDRGYEVGDMLRLEEFDPSTQEYTDRFITGVRITYILRHQDIADIPEGFALLSLRI